MREQNVSVYDKVGGLSKGTWLSFIQQREEMNIK